VRELVSRMEGRAVAEAVDGPTVVACPHRPSVHGCPGGTSVAFAWTRLEGDRSGRIGVETLRRLEESDLS
jgi:hypothetical protein